MSEFNGEGIFQEIEGKLIASIINNLRTYKPDQIGNKVQWLEWQTVQMKHLEKFKAEHQGRLSGEIKEFYDGIGELLRNCFDAGEKKQEADIFQAIDKGFKTRNKVSKGKEVKLSVINKEKLKSLITETRNGFKGAEYSILKKAEEEYRKVILCAPMYESRGAGTYEKAIDAAIKDFLSVGINCIEYRNGAKVNIISYASMVLKTAAKRAYFQGEGTMRQKWGISTVIINPRQSGCPKCVRFSGCVAIDDVWSAGNAEEGDYPLLSSFIADGLYHPNCKDGHTTYFPGVSELPRIFTGEERKKISDIYKLQMEQRCQEYTICKYRVLAENSLDQENKVRYEAKVNQWLKKNQEFIKKHSDILDKSEYRNGENGFADIVPVNGTRGLRYKDKSGIIDLAYKEGLDNSECDDGNLRSLEKSDLGELIGKGGNKEVYTFGSNKAVAIMQEGKPLSSIDYELEILRQLNELGFSTIGAERMMVDGRPAIIMDRCVQSSKSIAVFNKKKNKVVLVEGADTSLLNQNSFSDLNKIKENLFNQKVRIEDLQFLIKQDGHMVIADPLKVIVGEKPSRKNINMINILLEQIK